MKPWYKIVTPREDLRTGKPLDASEFAVHLDHVRDGKAPAVYQEPAAFFDRTYLTKNLSDLAVQVARRLNGVTLETSPVFNLSTQFGGGKTHALTLLFHLARGGADARRWKGVADILHRAGEQQVPVAETAVFVGTEFDSLAGRGGEDGTPLRKTPWGEIAFQLGGADGFAFVAEHDRTMTAPGGDVIEQFLPKDRPSLILMDELLNYIARARKSGMATQLYHFLQNLAGTVSSRTNVVLAVSLPASVLEMSAEDEQDFDRYKKLLDRVGKAIVMSAETETSEIIRRRLFEWSGLPTDAAETLDVMTEWMQTNKSALPTWFPHDKAREQLAATYPFHPSVLSVFERKWRALPRFQQTRGVLRLLALWVSRAYADGFKGAHRDALITLGTAPLEDSTFRAAMFDQLGESRLEGAVTTDIAGGAHAHAVRLDAAAAEHVRKARVHRKIASTILFESNGGQSRGEATLGDIRLAVADPVVQLADVEPCLEALTDQCYYLTVERNRYRFSFQANLNKLLADRRASVTPQSIQERALQEVQKVFGVGAAIDRVYFPKKSNDVADRALLVVAVVAPESPASDPATAKWLGTMTQENGASARTFKSAILWSVAEDNVALYDEARKLLAWQEIREDAGALHLDDDQTRQLVVHVKTAEGNLKEAVWRAYKNVYLLGEDNALRRIDLGLIHSSSSASLTDLIVNRLRQDDLIADVIAPNYLVRFWPPALPEWSTKAVRDAFYASPKLPRPLKVDVVRKMIASGVTGGQLAYVTKAADGSYDSLKTGVPMDGAIVELLEDVFIITRSHATAYAEALALKEAQAVAEASKADDQTAAEPKTDAETGAADVPVVGTKEKTSPGSGGRDAGGATYKAPPHPVLVAGAKLDGFVWQGDLTPQKWMNFYTKVLTPFVTGGGLKLSLKVEVTQPNGVSDSMVEEMRVALRELGVSEDVVKKVKPV